MAFRPTDPEAMHLFQLIGAPLLAVVQAEAQAAQTSAEYIKRIGFQSAEPGTDEAKAAPSLQDGGSFGDLKMAEFRIDRMAADGTPRPHTVRVPVLSLFPIPLLQVKDAHVEMDLRVLTRVPLGDPGDDKAAAPPPAAASPDFLAPERVELKGFLSPSSPAGGSATNQAHIKMRVHMSQSDMPAGLIQLMRIMGDSVTAEPVALTEVPRSPRPPAPAVEATNKGGEA
jgi:hypothetical protein